MWWFWTSVAWIWLWLLKLMTNTEYSVKHYTRCRGAVNFIPAGVHMWVIFPPSPQKQLELQLPTVFLCTHWSSLYFKVDCWLFFLCVELLVLWLFRSALGVKMFCQTDKWNHATYTVGLFVLWLWRAKRNKALEWFAKGKSSWVNNHIFQNSTTNRKH